MPSGDHAGSATVGSSINTMRSDPSSPITSMPRSDWKAIAACAHDAVAPVTVTAAVSDGPPVATIAMTRVRPAPRAVTRPALSTVATQLEPSPQANPTFATG